jgi:hypothetical protein
LPVGAPQPRAWMQSLTPCSAVRRSASRFGSGLWSERASARITRYSSTAAASRSKPVSASSGTARNDPSALCCSGASALLILIPSMVICAGEAGALRADRRWGLVALVPRTALPSPWGEP